MIKLYIDFDGVILNTIDITYKILSDKNINTRDKVKEFYKELDWNKLLEECTPINNSIDNLKKLSDSNLYDVSILSHVTSEEESNAKKKYLHKYIPNLDIITVDRDKNKCDVVDCKNTILVDDYMGNLNLWYDNGGIPIKFSDNGKKNNYMTISSLDTLLDKYEEIEKIIKDSKNYQ